MIESVLRGGNGDNGDNGACGGATLKIYTSSQKRKMREIRLVELGDEGMEEEIRASELVFRPSGGRGSVSVACSRTKTYAIMQREVSNTMLLAPPKYMKRRYMNNASGPADEEEKEEKNEMVATHEAASIVELVRTGMETEPVMRALRDRTYTTECETSDVHEDENAGDGDGDGDAKQEDDEERKHHGKSRIALDMLLRLGAASEAEVLHFMMACDSAIDMLDGTWMGIELCTVRHALDLFMLSCEELGLEGLTSNFVIDESTLLDAMREAEHGPAVTRHILRKFCEEGGADGTIDATGKWRVSRDKVALFRAVCILDEKPVMPLPDFMAAWKNACVGLDFGTDDDEDTLETGAQCKERDGLTTPPSATATIAAEGGEKLGEGASTKTKLVLTMLRGEALASTTGSVQRLRASELPLEPGARFDALFSFRSSWTWDDLGPYIASAAENSAATTETLLLKYARKVNSDGVERFVSKH